MNSPTVTVTKTDEAQMTVAPALGSLPLAVTQAVTAAARDQRRCRWGEPKTHQLPKAGRPMLSGKRLRHADVSHAVQHRPSRTSPQLYASMRQSRRPSAAAPPRTPWEQGPNGSSVVKRPVFCG
jgi:hypothetical protein